MSGLPAGIPYLGLTWWESTTLTPNIEEPGEAIGETSTGWREVIVGGGL